MPDALIHAPRPPLGDGTPGAPRLVVDVWLAVPTSDGWRALMLRRAPHRVVFWQGVSGRVEAEDATLAAAARRELREETGLQDGVEILDLGRWIEFTGPGSGRRFRKRSLGAVLPSGTRPRTLRLSDEHDEARLVPFAEARGMVRWPGNDEELAALEARVEDRALRRDRDVGARRPADPGDAPAARRPGR